MKTKLFALCLLVVMLFVAASPVLAMPLDGDHIRVMVEGYHIQVDTPHKTCNETGHCKPPVFCWELVGNSKAVCPSQ